MSYLNGICEQKYKINKAQHGAKEKHRTFDRCPKTNVYDEEICAKNNCFNLEGLSLQKISSNRLKH